jgi:hypothetical protein
MPDGDGAKKGGNWMRDQWVANLKKKRMANANGVSSAAAMPTTNARPQGNVRVSSVGVGIAGKGGNIAASRRHNATLEKNINAHHRNQHKHSQFATVDSQLIMSSQLVDNDAMVRHWPNAQRSSSPCSLVLVSLISGHAASGHDVQRYRFLRGRVAVVRARFPGDELATAGTARC